MGTQGTNHGFGHSASERPSSLFDTWPFSALQSRDQDPQGSFYLQQKHDRDYPDTGAFNSPVVSAALSSHAISPRFLGNTSSQMLSTVSPMSAGAGTMTYPRAMRPGPQQQHQQPQPNRGHVSEVLSASSSGQHCRPHGVTNNNVSAHASILNTPLKNFVMENPHHGNYYVKNPSSGVFMPILTRASRAGSATGFNPESKPSLHGTEPEDDRRYSQSWPYTGKSPSVIEFDTRASPSVTGQLLLDKQSPSSHQRLSNQQSAQNVARQRLAEQRRQHVHTVPLVGAWTINRWLSVLADNSSTSFMIWSIYPYSVKKREHAAHPGRLMFSQTFTTTRGYKIRAMVALNGTGAYESRYMSVFWQIMPSSEDHNLSWPMKDTVTVRVLPAGTNDAFSSTSVSGYVRNPKSFMRPEGKPTPPWGFKKFINHQFLESGHFIQADTLWLAFEVTEAGTAKFGQSNLRRRKTGDNLFGDIMSRFFFNKN